MKLAIIITTTNGETIFNAFRLANYALGQEDNVSIFLVGPGVEYESQNSEKFNIIDQAEQFVNSENAQILACGTCLNIRKQETTELCPISTLKDLYELVRDADKVLTF